MAGFIRRFGSFPSVETITQIEGVIIADLAPPGSVEGVGSGVVAVVGEFADMASATDVDSAGVISTQIIPQQIFSGQDLLDKMGGFDDTLGEWGKSLGNGFAAIKNKKYSGLVAAAVNMASAQGSRFFRDLPTNKLTTDATPIVPTQPGTVAAAREFRAGSNRLKAATRVEFTALPEITTGVAGSSIAGASAATQVFNAAAGFDWTLVDRGDGTLGARKGDILVIGNNDGLGGLSVDAGTYRVQADPASGIAITIERLDGANFAFTGVAGTVPWRLHVSSDADSAPVRVIGQTTPGGYNFGESGAYVVPIRPLMNASGAQSDGVYVAGTLLTPAVVPTAGTGSSWNSLSGVGAALHPVTATAFTAAVQGINAASAAVIDALYQTALDALISEDDPARTVNIVTCARKSNSIRASLRSHVLDASAVGLGRMAILSPELDQLTVGAVTATAAPGVGATRAERVAYSWPGCTHKVAEAVGFLLLGADGSVVSDGILDDTFDGWLASILSLLAPERNPGQAASPVNIVMAGVLGFQRGVSGLGLNEYIQLRSKGVAALRLDRTAGPIIQSGVTTSLISGEKNINRRRMADFIEDSLAQRTVQLSKLPLTESLKDQFIAETDAFLHELLSPDNPAAQRIDGYLIDELSGNTPASEAKGIYVLITKTRLTPTADFIVQQHEIGTGVVTSTTV